MPAVEISYSLDLDPKLPKELETIAKRQGEDPEKVCSLLQELKDLVYGKFNCKRQTYINLIYYCYFF